MSHERRLIVDVLEWACLVIVFTLVFLPCLAIAAGVGNVLFRLITGQP